MQHIKELNNAINAIKTECAKHINCDSCPMYDDVDCILNTGEPSDFKNIKENEN